MYLSILPTLQESDVHTWARILFGKILDIIPGCRYLKRERGEKHAIPYAAYCGAVHICLYQGCALSTYFISSQCLIQACHTMVEAGDL